MFSAKPTDIGDVQLVKRAGDWDRSLEAVGFDDGVSHIDDPTYVGARDRLDPAILAGYSSVGFPGIVVPMGRGSQGLPIAISFMGRPYGEGRLIGYAYDYEQATLLRQPSPLVPPLPG